MNVVIGVLVFTGVIVFWWCLNRWLKGMSKEDDEECALLKKMGEELPVLRYILDAPESEFSGMNLAEAMRVTREKIQKDPSKAREGFLI